MLIYKYYNHKLGVFMHEDGAYPSFSKWNRDWCRVGASEIDNASYALLEASSQSYVNALDRAFEQGVKQFDICI